MNAYITLSFLISLLLATPSVCAKNQMRDENSNYRKQRLNTAQTWMYQIQDLDQDGAVEALSATNFPLLVIEPGHNFIDYSYDTKGIIDALRTAPNGQPRLLLAYIDIGQAEDYRDYWGSGWIAPTGTECGYPDFLITVDPDGWSGNYPVAYWRKEWKSIWLGDSGIVAELARYGFDGIYLDWVEAYDDDYVRAVADNEDVNPEEEMIHFIEELGRAGRSVSEGFLVVPQNAPYLIDEDHVRYAAAIDALAVEDTWFHGEGDADWDDPNAGDLHNRHNGDWSTENRLMQYRVYQDLGLPIFSVDYCISLENASLVYSEARKAGLRPLVTRVSLSRLTETPPSYIPDGDVAPLGNRDGVVNVGDALVALRFALTLETPTQEDIQHGDVAPLDAQGKPNPDGIINVGDALVILRRALGIIQFPSKGPKVQKDKWSLWSGGVKLRGANVWQAVVIPGIYGDTMGTGAVGPPFTQADFNAMAAMGANYVNISHPGLYSVTAPYSLDEGVQGNLDNLLTMIAQADMFAVISFRTGPGRSEFTFNRDEVGDWFKQSDLIETVWTDTNAQAAWAQMWRYVANRYKENPIVAGYDLMVEPNSPEVIGEIYEPDEYYPTYANNVHDWNKIYPPIVAGIREMDTKTPIISSCPGYGAVSWLPYLELVNDNRVVYAVHQYDPHDYTHQNNSASTNTYPGQIDLDWDGTPDPFNKSTLTDIMSVVGQFKTGKGVAVVVNEFGPMRFLSGAAAYFTDMTDLFDQSAVNNAFWEYAPSFASGNSEITWDYFNFKHGPDPNNHTDVTTSDLIQAIKNYWSRNTLRPSNW